MARLQKEYSVYLIKVDKKNATAAANVSTTAR